MLQGLSWRYINGLCKQEEWTTISSRENVSRENAIDEITCTAHRHALKILFV